VAVDEATIETVRQSSQGEAAPNPNRRNLAWFGIFE
jgi:hypothetical protein